MADRKLVNASPFIMRPTRFHRFAIVLAVVCASCMLLAWWMGRQRTALLSRTCAALESQGVGIEYEVNRNTFFHSVQRLLGVDSKEVLGVSLFAVTVDESTIELINRLPRVETFSCSHSQWEVEQESLFEQLAPRVECTDVSFSGTVHLNDARLITRCFPNAQWVDVSGTSLGADDIALLYRLPALRSMYHDSCENAATGHVPDVTNAAQLTDIILCRLPPEQFAKLRPMVSLSSLSLVDSTLDRAAMELLADLPNLTALSLSNCVVETLLPLTSQRPIGRLSLSGTTITEKLLTEASSFQQLRGLDLWEVPGGVDATLGKLLTNLPITGELAINGSKISEEAIILLLEHPTLEELRLEGVTISWGDSLPWPSTSHVKQLYFVETEVPEENRKAIETSLAGPLIRFAEDVRHPR